MGAALPAASPEQPRDPIPTSALYVFGGFAVVLGSTLRLLPILSASFPLGDGGLFYAMVRDLLANHLALPRFTSYNGGHIPFVYPPFGFYVIATLHDLTGVPVLQLFQFVPALFAVLTLLAFGLLARALLISRLATLGAIFAFALLPDSFFWEIKGGGVARAPGQLFAILTLWSVLRLYQRRSWRWLVPAALFASLTVLSHPEWAWFAVYSSAVLFVAFGRTGFGLRSSIALVVATAVLSSPWWLVALLRFGPGPILSAFAGAPGVYGRLDGVLALVNLGLTSEIGFPIIAGLALTGLAISLATRRWLLPAWLLVMALVDPHGVTTLSRTVVVVALLAGVGFEIWMQLIVRVRALTLLAGVPSGSRAVSRTLALVIGLLVVRSMLLSSIQASDDRPLRAPQRAAMSWIAAHTPPNSRFAVVTAQDWGFDDTSEWFPALTNRISVNTVQGSEWLGGAFARQTQLDARLQRCADRNATCLLHWLGTSGTFVRYFYISKQQPEASIPCCQPLLTSLSASSAFHPIFTNPAATIYRFP